MKDIVLSILLASIFNEGFAQEKNILEKDFKAYRNAIIVKPLQVVDISHPRISLGYETMLDPRKFLSFTASYYLNNYLESKRNENFVDIYLRPTRGYGVEIAHKWFNEKLWYYAASISIASIIYNSNHEFNWTGSQGNTIESLEFFNVNKTLIEPSFVYGKRIRPTDKLFFDLFAAIGLRIKETAHTETTAPDGASMYATKNLYYYRDRQGTFLSPTIKVGVIVGFKF